MSKGGREGVLVGSFSLPEVRVSDEFAFPPIPCIGKGWGGMKKISIPWN